MSHRSLLRNGLPSAASVAGQAESQALGSCVATGCSVEGFENRKTRVQIRPLLLTELYDCEHITCFQASLPSSEGGGGGAIDPSLQDGNEDKMQ